MFEKIWPGAISVGFIKLVIENLVYNFAKGVECKEPKNVRGKAMSGENEESIQVIIYIVVSVLGPNYLVVSQFWHKLIN